MRSFVLYRVEQCLGWMRKWSSYVRRTGLIGFKVFQEVESLLMSLTVCSRRWFHVLPPLNPPEGDFFVLLPWPCVPLHWSVQITGAAGHQLYFLLAPGLNLLTLYFWAGWTSTPVIKIARPRSLQSQSLRQVLETVKCLCICANVIVSVNAASSGGHKQLYQWIDVSVNRWINSR